MFNLNEIIQAAHGGDGINNIAQQFGISPEQAQAAIKAMLPGMSQGLQNTATSGGLGEILAHIGNPQNQKTFDDPAAAASDETAAAGGGALGQIFGGNSQITQQIAQHAAQHSGLSADLLQQMMPVIASMVMGGLFKSASNQGLGGLLGQLTGQGNLGSILGQALGGGQTAPAPTPGAPASGGGIGGMLGGMLGGLFGGGQAGATHPAGGIDTATVQAGMDALTKMFGHGVQVPQGQQAGLQDIIGQMMSGKR